MSTKTTLLSAAAVVFSASAAIAGSAPTSSPPPSSNSNSLTVSAEALWLSADLGDTYFATKSPISTPSFPNGVRVSNELDPQFGFRVGLALDFGSANRRVQANYTHLEADNTELVSGSFLWATVGRADLTSQFENYAGTASSVIDTSYDRFDLLLSEPLKWSDARLSLLYGIEYADIELDETHTYVGPGPTTGIVRNSSEVSGVGPELGFDLAWDLLQNGDMLPGMLSLNVLSTGSLLLADTETAATNVLNAATLLSVVDESTTRLVPALHMRLGLAYETAMSGASARLALGYEFHSYFGGVGRTSYPDDVADGLSSTAYDNFDLSGPYAGLAVRF